MPTTVSLKALVDEMETVGDEITVYLNRSTGAFVMITDEDRSAARRIEEGEKTLGDHPEWQHQSIRAAGIVDESDDYISIPDRFDIDESEIMRRFARSIEESEMYYTLVDSLRGRGAFRRFKDAIHHFGLADSWYRFRAQAFEQVAIKWLKANEIPYANDIHSATGQE